MTIEKIQSTETYQKASFIGKQFLIKRANREIINNAIIVYCNTKIIPGNISGVNLLIAKELIVLDNLKQHSINNPEPKI